MKTRKSWKEKLEDSKDLPRVIAIPARMKAKWGKGTMVIPAPKEVDEMMRRVPRKKLATVNQVRTALAQKHKTTMACPMTTGIFAWIAANAADEEIAARPKARVTPYWRTLKAGGVLNEKYPGGVDRQRQQLQAEGHTVVKKGRDHFVADHEKKLFDFGVK
jgi:hypothetical protein